MSMPVIRGEVAAMLAQANHQIAVAEAALTRSSDLGKIRAAGELAFLKRQQETLQQRLAEIDRAPGATESVFQWIREEWFNLTLRLQDWLAHV